MKTLTTSQIYPSHTNLDRNTSPLRRRPPQQQWRVTFSPSTTNSLLKRFTNPIPIAQNALQYGDGKMKTRRWAETQTLAWEADRALVPFTIFHKVAHDASTKVILLDSMGFRLFYIRLSYSW
ncbi:hypothetical protein M407DRAFT_167756 [Tulasnella calospora MUT 4182]|uniref:Uncharacterized protein n=1 Tax=Tulasnella calospora MUT 4182 TaxID=1051891 RepID=A0A0C3L8A9_9AGAM|nr:hypothetical protein M407DRAFT_167756 [Tulasnella calospora MUT 4182]